MIQTNASEEKVEIIGPLLHQKNPTAFDPMDHETPWEDLKALTELVREFQNPIKIIEIGSWAGLSALSITVGMTNKDDALFCIDTWEGNPNDRLGEVAKRYGPKKAFQTFCHNMRNLLFQNVFPCVGHSLTYAAIWPFPVNMVYIDGNHDQCAQDIRAWWPHVIDGGILAGHDYGVFPGVTEAVDKFGPAELHGCSVWVLRKS